MSTHMEQGEPEGGPDALDIAGGAKPSKVALTMTHPFRPKALPFVQSTDQFVSLLYTYRVTMYGATMSLSNPGIAAMKRAPVHPGEVFKVEFREASTPPVSQVEAARRLQIPTNRLNEFERGRRGVTPDSAIRLSLLTGTSPEFWMNLQAQLELWHAYQSLRKRGVLAKLRRTTAVGRGH